VVRLGAVEEVAGGSLPSALGRFATLHPGVKMFADGEDSRTVPSAEFEADTAGAGPWRSQDGICYPSGPHLHSCD
jgi:hypothetical protein